MTSPSFSKQVGSLLLASFVSLTAYGNGEIISCPGPGPCYWETGRGGTVRVYESRTVSMAPGEYAGTTTQCPENTVIIGGGCESFEPPYRGVGDVVLTKAWPALYERHSDYECRFYNPSDETVSVVLAALAVCAK